MAPKPNILFFLPKGLNNVSFVKINTKFAPKIPFVVQPFWLKRTSKLVVDYGHVVLNYEYRFFFGSMYL